MASLPGIKSDIPDIHKLIDALPDPEPQITTFTESVSYQKRSLPLMKKTDTGPVQS